MRLAPLPDRSREVQLRYPSALTSQEYVATQAWRDATLPACPVHGADCRRFARHGTYSRYTPWGPAKIARFYCRDAQQTFSLLPDCFAAQLTGTLVELEAEVVLAERAGVAAAAPESHPRTGTPVGVRRRDAVRRLDRRVALVLACLAVIRGLFPELFGACPARLCAMRAACGLDPLLLSLRRMEAMPLQSAPAPVGFRRRSGRTDPVRGHQHSRVRDPPVGAAYCGGDEQHRRRKPR